jgi:hypothetical protein
MPPLPKSADRRQRRNKRPGMALVPSGSGVPRPPEKLLKATATRWTAFWATDEGQATRPAEVPQVERMFRLLDEEERSWRAIRRQGRMVTGSQGQPVSHPLLKYIGDCLREIRALEDRLGLSRRAMVALGASYATVQRSIEELNQVMGDDEDQDDPRLHAVQ